MITMLGSCITGQTDRHQQDHNFELLYHRTDTNMITMLGSCKTRQTDGHQDDYNVELYLYPHVEFMIKSSGGFANTS